MSHTRRNFLYSLAAAPVLPKLADVWKEATIPVGLRKQLLVDDYVISTRSNLTRELGKPRKLNDGKPVMKAKQPDENPDSGFGGWFNVLYDSGRFRMWYPSRFSAKEAYTSGYAESQDGLDWTRPPVGRNGTNLLLSHGGGFTCSFDPHETDPDHRYKAAYSSMDTRACLAHSPDGIRWTPYNQGKPVTGRAADTINQIVWDEDARLYRLFTRTDFGTPGGSTEFRGTRGMTNPDVKANPANWTTVRSWLFDREGAAEVRRRQIQALADWIYEGVHFALMTVHEWPLGEADPSKPNPDRDLVLRHERDVVNFYLATSRDADQWDLSWVYAQKPFVPRGPNGSFDKDMIFAGATVATWQGRHWFYYTGASERHWVFPRPLAIGGATLRQDGMIFVQPWRSEEPAWLITKPFRLDGRFLEVNVDAQGGSLIASVLDLDARPLPGFDAADALPLAKDDLRARPRWKQHADLSSLLGRVVRLQFRLHSARLYAFHVKTEPRPSGSVR